MKRLLISCAIALPMVALTAGPVMAEVKTREKTHVSLGGMMGKMFNLFGGKAAKEGVVATTAVKGNRKATMKRNSQANPIWASGSQNHSRVRGCPVIQPSKSQK